MAAAGCIFFVPYYFTPFTLCTIFALVNFAEVIDSCCRTKPVNTIYYHASIWHCHRTKCIQDLQSRAFLSLAAWFTRQSVRRGDIITISLLPSAPLLCVAARFAWRLASWSLWARWTRHKTRALHPRAEQCRQRPAAMDHRMHLTTNKSYFFLNLNALLD